MPDFRRRHVFSAKLRLLTFLSFWIIYLYFMRGLLPQTKGVSLTVLASFVGVSFAYYNIMRERWLIPSFFIELISDLAAITAVIYLSGGASSQYYTLYIFYVFLVGVLYNYRLAALSSVAVVACYGAFLWICERGIIPPFIMTYDQAGSIPVFSPFYNFAFASIALVGIIYSVYVAGFFTRQREALLERRNRELTALHRMSSSVRSVAELHEIIDRLLAGILDGIAFESAVLVHFDRQSSIARIYTPGRHPKLPEIERKLGRSLDGIEFPLEVIEGRAMEDILNKKILFRRSLAELAEGFETVISREQCEAIQMAMGARRIVAVPIVVEREVLGALLGFSREPFVEAEQVATMEAFANQSAMSLEAAILIDRLRRANEELKELSHVKSQFLATMSHELRTPLTAIIGFSELLIEGVMGEMVDEQRECVQEVLHNSADLLDMINSILDLAKVESGKMRLEVRPFPLEEVVRRSCSTISPLTQRKGQRLTIEIAEGVGLLEGDEKKIGQVVLNLLANANKFTPDGGEIFARVRLFRSIADINERASWVSRLRNSLVRLSDGCYEIEIEDTGIGIREEELSTIFDMFHQSDSSATRSFGGTGLGLSLAKQFIEMHGGSIWAESRLGSGTRFTALIPIKFNPSHYQAPSHPGPAWPNVSSEGWGE